MVMPPLGLAYVSAMLKYHGVPVEILDLAKSPDTKLPDTDMFAVGSTTPQFFDAVEFKNRVRRERPEAKICLAGPHATLNPKEALYNMFDSVIVGEGEHAIFKFIDGQSGVIRCPDEPDLDIFPFPDRSFMGEYNYRIGGLRATTMMTSRGCPYNCSFCCKSWGGVRYRTSRNVWIEAAQLKTMGYEAVQFYDDEFLVRPLRDLAIFSEMKRVGLIWRCFTRANLITQDLAEVMKTCGCHEVLLGVESGSNTILKAIRKGTTVAQNMQAIKLLHNAGIKVKAAMVVGLPSETTTTLVETWTFCEEVEDLVDSWDFTIFTPYPGSDVFDNPDNYDIYFHPFAPYYPYKGGKWEANVWTTDLASSEITAWRNDFHTRFKGEIY
jgi:anaerobic magnesium-protoporphyrin IX monomethyl ester cyclase